MTIVPIITTSIGCVNQQRYEFLKSLTYQNFTTCYVAAVHDSIYTVSCSCFNRAVQVLRREHGNNRRGNVEASSNYDLRPNFLLTFMFTQTLITVHLNALYLSVT